VATFNRNTRAPSSGITGRFPSEQEGGIVGIRTYAIGKYEVTNQEYADILNWAHARGRLTNSSGGAYTGGVVYAHGQWLANTVSSSSFSQIEYGGGSFTARSLDGHAMANHPMVMVSWYGAAMYCNWLSEKEGCTPVYDTSTWSANFSNNGYHLPTEAQWERAAAWDPVQERHYRYGNGSDSISCATANFVEFDFCNPLGLTFMPYTSPVGYFSGVTSPAGCYDMAGNVWEWCNDWSKRTYMSAEVSNPQGPPSGSNRVIRGGSWISPGSHCRSAFRFVDDPSYADVFGGFRLAR
jgi:formylglycine-generating enzyme required for sulfatase activity